MSRKQQNTVPQIMLPDATLYQRHALGLLSLLTFTDDHLHGFESLFPEGYADAVVWRRIFEKSAALREEAQAQLATIMARADLTDEMYHNETNAMKDCIEFEPVEPLIVLVKLRQATDQWRAIGRKGLIELLRREADRIDPPHQQGGAMNATETPLERWERLCRELTHPDVELTTEEFALLLSAYKRLLALGHQFDVGTLALMTVLEREAMNTDDDSDRDVSVDDGREDDDPDEDGSDVDDGKENDLNGRRAA